MLHDFFLYDWHDKTRGLDGTGLTSQNSPAKRPKYFDITQKEKDIILRHIKSTVTPPKYIESMIVSLADKTVTVLETFKLFKTKF